MVMREYRTRSMEDVGVGVPVLMPLPPDPAVVEDVVRHASVTRGEGLRLARREIAKDRAATLRVVLSLLKVLVIPRVEEVLASDAMTDAKIECGPGCNACCYQNVEVSIPEAILVSLQLADPRDPRREPLLQAAADFAGLSRSDRVRTRRPCPLLVEGKCSVYDNRPVLCRATLSPCARKCYAALEEKEPPDVYVVAQYFAIGDKDALRGICRDLGLQNDNVELVQTVAAILSDPSTVVRWAAGEHVFAPLSKLN
jgi:Fe-S-cluster containining protein